MKNIPAFGHRSSFELLEGVVAVDLAEVLFLFVKGVFYGLDVVHDVEEGVHKKIEPIVEFAIVEGLE